MEIVSIRDRVQSGTGDEGWTVHADGSLRYRGRVVVPQLTNLRDEILMSAKLIYVLSSFHMLFCAFHIHIHVKLIKFPLNLVL